MSSSIEIVESKCLDALASLGLAGDGPYIARLSEEIGDLKVWESTGTDKARKILSMAKNAVPSGANSSGSLVLYLLGISSVDPVKNGMDISRKLIQCDSPPDIDTDFNPDVRDEVKKEIVEMFGQDKVCSIGTYQTYKTCAVIVDVARALGLDVREAMAVTKEVEALKSFENEDGSSSIVDKMSFEDVRRHYKALDRYLANNPEVLRHASVLRNQVRNMGKHAGGLIISDLDLKDRIPICKTQEGDILSTWAESGNAQELSAVGLIKYDILGLKNLSVVSECVRLIRETKGIDLKDADIPIDDREAIRLQARSDLVGIFQFENPATKEIVDAVGVDSLDDISAVTSLLRPGPKDMGMHMLYADHKNGRKPYAIKECLKPILGDTYSILTYQEQAMQISKVLAGFTGPEANKLRKVIGKKKPDAMAAMKSKFVKGSQPRIDSGEFTTQEVEDMWNLIESFAGYGFNKSHAVSYSSLTTQELWLKHNYFTEYMAALLANTRIGDKKHGSDNLMGDYINYARSKGTIVLPPSVNKSKTTFSIERGFIRYSLSHVKGVSSAAEVIVKHQPYSSVKDFVDRCFEMKPAPGNKMRKHAPTSKVVEALIRAGAFDDFGDANEIAAEYDRLKKRKNPLLAEPVNRMRRRLDEKELIGAVLSEKPLVNRYEKEIAENKWQTIGNEGVKKNVNVICIIESIESRMTKKKSPMLVVSATDGVYSMKFYVWSADISYFKGKCEVGSVCVVPLDRFEDEEITMNGIEKKIGPRFFNGRREPKMLERAPK